MGSSEPRAINIVQRRKDLALKRASLIGRCGRRPSLRGSRREVNRGRHGPAGCSVVRTNIMASCKSAASQPAKKGKKKSAEQASRKTTA